MREGVLVGGNGHPQRSGGDGPGPHRLPSPSAASPSRSVLANRTPASLSCPDPKETKATLQTETLEAVADRGYFSGEEILACDRAGITVTLPKPMTSGAKPEGRFGKQDFIYLPEEDIYRCPAGERLKYSFTNVENGLTLRRDWTNECRACALKSRCTTGVQRRITRWEHEPVVDYNLTRVMNIVGIQPLMAAIQGVGRPRGHHATRSNPNTARIAFGRKSTTIAHNDHIATYRPGREP